MPAKVRKHRRNGRRRSPAFSGVFARVCWTSPNTNQSGRTVRVGLNTGDSGPLLRDLRRPCHVEAGVPAKSCLLYAIVNKRLVTWSLVRRHRVVGGESGRYRRRLEAVMPQRAEVVLSAQEREVLEHWAAPQERSGPQDPLNPAVARTPSPLHTDLQLVAEPGRALVRGADHEMDQAQRSPLSPRTRRLNPHLDHQLERRPNPYVWHKTADEILDSLAHYCQRITDSDH
jgi:hypothetical protein